MNQWQEAGAGSGMAGVVDRNIHALLERRSQDEQRRGMQDKIADKITAFTGSMTFVYIHLVVFGAWVVINLGLTPLPEFDPTFVVLAMVASVEAIFLSTFVLITQNRMATLADERANLDLQISLLAEHEITRLIALVAEMANKMGIEESANPELDELKKDVHPEKVLDRIEQTEKKHLENARTF